MDEAENQVLSISEDVGEDQAPRRYELGCLLSPLLAAESLADTIETLIRKPIMDVGGQIVDSKEPQSISLAYPIRKRIDNKNLRFREAHLISLRFLVPPEEIAALDRIFRFSPLLLRCLLIELPIRAEKPRRQPKGPLPPSAGSSREDEPEEGAMSQADMDREIEGLLNHVSQ